MKESISKQRELLNNDDLLNFINDISEGNINNIVVKLNNYYNEGKNILTLTQDLINTLENEYIKLPASI